jgi:hypothetical protein
MEKLLTHSYDSISQAIAFQAIIDASKWGVGTYSNFRGAQSLVSAVDCIY